MSHNGLSRCYSKVVKCEAAVQSSATETLIRSVCICLRAYSPGHHMHHGIGAVKLGTVYGRLKTPV